MHPVLLKGQGLTIERPPRTMGTLIGAGASSLALVLAAALVARAFGWPVSFTQFLAYLGAGVLIVLAAIFGFWAYGCFSLRYVMDRTGLTVAWGPVKHFVAIDRITALTHGRGEQKLTTGGLGWWGYHIGCGHVEGFGDVLFFSTHRAPEELVYVQTAAATYGLSPADPVRFIAEAQRFLQAGKPERRAAVHRDPVAAHPIWADHTGQILGAAGVILNVALWGFVCAIYPSLSNEITMEFPPIGDIATLHSRAGILKIPATASAILALNLFAGLVFEWKERAAAYLLLSGAIVFQAVFWVAAFVALANA